MDNVGEFLSVQAQWLEGLLAENPNKWTVVTFHHPMYSPTGRDNKELRELWRPVFDRYGVDLVLTGHDHAYGRSGLMRAWNPWLVWFLVTTTSFTPMRAHSARRRATRSSAAAGGGTGP